MRALDLLLNSLALLAQAQPVALRAAGDSPQHIPDAHVQVEPELAALTAHEPSASNHQDVARLLVAQNALLK